MMFVHASFLFLHAWLQFRCSNPIERDTTMWLAWQDAAQKQSAPLLPISLSLSVSVSLSENVLKQSIKKLARRGL
jgi:hypothetical protein